MKYVTFLLIFMLTQFFTSCASTETKTATAENEIPQEQLVEAGAAVETEEPNKTTEVWRFRRETKSEDGKISISDGKVNHYSNGSVGFEIDGVEKLCTYTMTDDWENYFYENIEDTNDAINVTIVETTDSAAIWTSWENQMESKWNLVKVN